jgi:hypothetical protein
VYFPFVPALGDPFFVPPFILKAPNKWRTGAQSCLQFCTFLAQCVELL